MLLTIVWMGSNGRCISLVRASWNATGTFEEGTVKEISKRLNGKSCFMLRLEWRRFSSDSTVSKTNQPHFAKNPKVQLRCTHCTPRERALRLRQFFGHAPILRRVHSTFVRSCTRLFLHDVTECLHSTLQAVPGT